MLTKKSVLISLLILVFLSVPSLSFAQEDPKKEILETKALDINKPVYRFTVGGNLTLNQENSFWRVILVDKDKKEYLIYEANPLTESQKFFSFTNVCEESCVLEGIVPDSVRIEGYAAKYEITNFSSIDDFQKLSSQIKSLGLQEARENLQQEKESLKIKKINEQIKANGLKWIAGETSVSILSYEQKKKLFSKPDGSPADKFPNLQGFEYYKSGIFELKSENKSAKQAQATGESVNLPVSWDWRNVHGENWNTPIKDQGIGGTCWAHSLMGTLESYINLYYNQHLNNNLSEQMILDCINGDSLPLSMRRDRYSQCNPDDHCYETRDYCVLGIHGISDEACDPYDQTRDNLDAANCTSNNICGNWQNRVWKFTDYHGFGFSPYYAEPICSTHTPDPSEDTVKRTLIQKGPMDSGISSWGHAMVLEGYDGQSNWSSVQYCNASEMCTPNQGCITQECDVLGDEMTVCNNNFYDDGTHFSGFYTYQCQADTWGRFENVWKFKNVLPCGNGMMCVANQCQPEQNYHLLPGKRECASFDQYSSFYRELKEYTPCTGDTVWIFKNSWGTNWGEAGYARISSSLSNLGWTVYLSGPVIPPNDRSFWPAGFDRTIKCVDKDNDKYCNWGISENKPETCSAFCKPEKDCDDSNPDLGPFDGNLNCMPICLLRNKGDLGCDELIDETDLTALLARWGEANLPTIETLLQNWKTGI